MSDERESQEALHAPSDEETVLKLFGIDVKVKNPRLAEVLKMDAAEALRTDVRELVDPGPARRRREELREALPDSMLAPETPRDRATEHAQKELRARVEALGGALGFDVSPDGTWSSPSGLSLYVRVVSSEISYAGASDMLHKLEGYRKGAGSTDDGFLIVTRDQRGADIVSVAIRQGSFHAHTRTLSIATLERIRRHVSADAAHEFVTALLLPIASVDVAALLGPESSDNEDIDA